MVNYNLLQNLPSSDELPDSDDTPVDNELQNLIPILLRAILSLIWSERLDWVFGVNMGIYHTTGKSPRVAIVPDGFLSFSGRLKNGKLRPSYIVWEENNIVPIFVLEVVSETYGREYFKDDETADEPSKITQYARLGVLYYAIYNPDYWRRDKHDPFEVYRLMDGAYQRQLGEPVWMPEVGLGIGRSRGTYDRCDREFLYWYDANGHRFPTPDEVILQERQRTELERQHAEVERQRAEVERQRAEQLAELLRQRGIDPDALD